MIFSLTITFYHIIILYSGEYHKKGFPFSLHLVHSSDVGFNQINLDFLFQDYVNLKKLFR